MTLSASREKFYLNKLNFKQFTPFQKKVFSAFSGKSNLVLNAKTGTGKTYAYSIPLVESVTSAPNQAAIIFVPTLELQSQTRKMISSLLPQNSNLLVSSINYEKGEIIKRTKSHQPWILITTIFEFEKYLSWGCDFSAVKCLVFDEADMLCESDALEKIIKIAKYFKDIRKVLVSATITTNLKPFITNYFGAFRQIGTDNPFAGQKHILIKSGLSTTDEVVARLLKIINPYLLVIFTSKVERIDKISNLLTSLNLKHLTISSRDTLSLRRQKLVSIKENKYQYVVASDLLSRGLNLNCSHVLNYDLPIDLDYFTHRAGRTARMGETGVVYTILSKTNERAVARLHSKGVPFKNYELKNDNLVLLDKPRNASPVVAQAISTVKKPSRVKPNYKKRYLQEVNKRIKQAKVKEMLKQKRLKKFREEK